MDARIRQRSKRSVDFASCGPDSLAGQFLRKFWHPVFVSEDLPRSAAKPIEILGEKFTLYRGESGTAFVVGFRCAHRNTQLSTGWVKDDCIRCFYHGWTYDGSGACVERPGEIPSGPAVNIHIPAYPTREHMGLVYAFFGDGEPPAFPPFPEFDSPGFIETSMLEFPCNWFQTYENHADEAHLSFVHSTGGSHNALGHTQVKLREVSAEETDFGMVRYSRMDERGKRRSTLYLFPTTMRIIIPPFNDMLMGGWRDSYLTLTPTNDENHILFMTQHVSVAEAEQLAYRKGRDQDRELMSTARTLGDIAREILDGRAKLSDFRDHPRFLLVEDAVAQGGQGWIVDRSAEHLGRTDVCIIRMRRLFERELRAVAEGRATKQFRYSGEKPDLGF